MARIGFDLDGVVYNFRRGLSDYLVSLGLAQCVGAEQDPSYDFFEAWGFTVDDFMRHYTDAVDAGVLLRFGDPMPDAVWATEELTRQGHTIHIVTDRSVGTAPGVSSRATAGWLADHGFVFHSLTFSRDKTVVPVDVFIEDNRGNADALTAAGTPCYLINRPWNEPRDDGRLRVDTLREFVDVVTALTMAAA